MPAGQRAFKNLLVHREACSSVKLMALTGVGQGQEGGIRAQKGAS